ncbi:MAG: energy-coupling factor transporter transmembrane protein EcfT [Clostridia bacterium]|nr:energy-coupling factor transporter transmembrane protein EcfT [Clostridia bacterium]
MTISIGQYLPGNSVIHRADPRAKLALTIVYMILVLLTHSFVGFGLIFLYLAGALLAAQIRPKYIWNSMKPVLLIVIFTLVLNLFFYQGETVLFDRWFVTIYLESVIFCIRMCLRIIFLVVGVSIVTYTTTPVMLTDGIEALLSPLKVIHFPVHEIAMMMSIALRFIPTFAEETDRIMKAQTARGSDFDSKNLLERIRSFVPILIPLFISAWRRAEELANAMNARCYRGGEGRSRFRVLKLTRIDVVMIVVSAVFAAGVIVIRILGVW